MKRADSCFRWNIVATLLNGKIIELVDSYGTIYDIGEALEKHGLKVSDSTLYGMKKVQDREYLAAPLRAVDIAPSYQKELGINGENVAEWHLKVGRKMSNE